MLAAPRRGFVVGVISDTHGLARVEALAALGDVDAIVHAGDVGDSRVLEALEAMAPVTAVRGNVDVEGRAACLPPTAVLEIGGASIYVLHDLDRLDLDPRAAGFDAVVHGHSHRPAVERRRDVLFLNPGSAGPRRFALPVSVARLSVHEGRLRAELLVLRI